MEIIQLQNQKGDWGVHRFSDTTQRNEEFRKRGIVVGENVTFGRFAMIGDLATIGDNVSLDEECVVSQGATVKEGVVLEKEAFVGERSIIAQGCTIGKDAFVGKGSHINEGSVLTDKAEVGDDVYIGNDSVIGRGSIIMHGAYISSDNIIGEDVYIGHNTHTGVGNIVGDRTRIFREVIIQDQARIDADARIPSWSTVQMKGEKADIRKQDEMQRIKTEQLQYEQVIAFTSMEGNLGLKVKMDGKWLPTARIGAEDQQSYIEGRMTLNQLADKYVAPEYLRQKYDTEQRMTGSSWHR